MPSKGEGVFVVQTAMFSEIDDLTRPLRHHPNSITSISQ